jgi:hypothetical protein
MNGAVREIGPGDPITVETLIDFRQRLMGNSHLVLPPR